MGISLGEFEATLRLRDQLTPALRTASAQFAQFSKDVKGMGDSLASAGRTLTTAITLPLGAMGAAAVASGTSFIKQMNLVSAVTDASAEDFDRLKQAALEWGNKTQFSASEAAGAMVDLGKAGFDANQSIEALPSTLNLAAAANMSLSDAATLTSNVMKTFGLEVTDLAHANDILASAANSSTIEVADLRESFKYVGPVAAQAGVSLADASAAMALMGEAGIKGSMAGTTLRNALTTLMTPTKKQAELMHELGLEGVYANGKMADMSEVIDRIARSGKDSSLVLELFGDRAGPGMAALVQKGSLALSMLTAQLDNTHGSAQRMADAAMKGFPGAMERMRGAIETAGASVLSALEPAMVAGANAIAAMADFVTMRLVPAFQRLSPEMQTTIIATTGLAAAVGPLLIALGGLMQVVGVGAKGLQALTAAMAWFGRTTAVTTAYVWAADAAGGALLLTLKGIGLILGYVAAAFIGWKLGPMIGDWIGLSDHIEYASLKLQRWLGLIDQAATNQDLWNSVQANTARRTKEVSAATEAQAQAYQTLKDRLSGAFDAKNLADITQVITELGNAGQLSGPVLARVAMELQAIAASGAVLPPHLQRIVELYGKATTAASDLADASKDLQEAWGSGAAKDLKELVAAWRALPPVLRENQQIQQNMLNDYEDLRALVEPNALPSDIENLWQQYEELAASGHRMAASHGELEDAQKAVNKSMEGGINIWQTMAQAAGDLRLTGRDVTDMAKQFSPAWRDVNGNFLSTLPVLEDLKARMKRAREEFVKTHGALATAMMDFQQGKVYGALQTVDQVLEGINAEWAQMASLVVQTGTAIIDNLAKGDWIGAIVAGVTGLGKALYNVFGNAEAKKVNDMRDAWEDAFGSFEDLHAKANDAGIDITRYLSADTVEEYEAAIKELEDAFEKLDDAVKQYGLTYKDLFDPNRRVNAFEDKLTELIDTFEMLTHAGYDTDAVLGAMGEDFLAALNEANEAGVLEPLLQQLVDAGKLTQEMADALRGFVASAGPDFAALTEMADGYGITLEQLGPAFQQAHISETATQIAEDFEALIAAGADVNGVMVGMQDEVQALLDDAFAFGSAIPNAMRPLLEQMVASGLLVDENGEKLTDLSGIDFADSPLEQGLDNLTDAIRALIEALGGVPDAIDAIANTPVPEVRIPIVYDDPGYVGEGNMQSFHQGVSWVKAHSGLRLDEVPAILQTGESVLNRRATASLGSAAIDSLNMSGGMGGAMNGADAIDRLANVERELAGMRRDWEFTIPDLIAKAVTIKRAKEGAR